MLDYTVVVFNPNFPQQFASTIQSLLLQGWVPLGGIAIQSNGYMAQAFTINLLPGSLLTVVSPPADYVVTESPGTVFIMDTAGAARTLTLPPSPGVGSNFYVVQNSNANPLLIDPNGYALQGVAAPGAPPSVNPGSMLVFDGTSWWFS